MEEQKLNENKDNLNSNIEIHKLNIIIIRIITY